VRWQEVTIRLALIACSFGAVAYGLTTWITAPLGFIAIGATAELAVRPYARSAADRLILGCGGVVTAFILIGLVLNLTPWGLNRATWSGAGLIFGVGVLIWRGRLGASLRRPDTSFGSTSAWVAAAILVVILSVVLAEAGVRAWDRKPILAFSLASKDANSVVVEIEATSTSGRYRVVAASKVPRSRRYSSALLSIRAGANGGRVDVHVPINVAGHWVIDLQSPGGATLRSLVVNVGEVGSGNR
jgi:hypothetical protein